MVNKQLRRNSFLNCNSNPSPAGNCKQKLKKLQAIDFSIAEIILYLNAYPKSTEAIKYFKMLKEEREKLLAEMKADGCPPITAQSADPNSEWDWTNAPWPWEPEAN